MADCPYYHADGRAFRLTAQDVAPPDLSQARNTSYLQPKPGAVLRLTGSAGKSMMPRVERMPHDKDMPMNLRVGMLAQFAPHVPHHVLHTLVHNSPDLTVAELASVLQVLSYEEVLLNSHREDPAPPKEAPPLPVLDPETREAPLQCLVPKRPPRQRKGVVQRVQGCSWTAAAAVPEGGPCGASGAAEDEPSRANVPRECHSSEASSTSGGASTAWDCSRCTLENPPSASTCAACDQPRPTPALCAAPGRCKKVSPTQAVKAGPSRSPAAQELPLTFQYEPALILHYELQPGLVLVKSMMDIKTQQWVVDEAFRLGNNPDGRTGGFFRVTESGEVTLNQVHRAQFGEQLDAFAPHFRELCLHFFRFARPCSRALPDMEAHWCNFNFYAPNSKGIAWHRDGDETKERLNAGTGRPVVSFSLGDSCDFRWKNHRHEDDNVLRLESGDVLLFGGPSRGILHSVTRVYPSTAPKLLRMRAGRLNLTYRHSHDEDRA